LTGTNDCQTTTEQLQFSQVSCKTCSIRLTYSTGRSMQRNVFDLSSCGLRKNKMNMCTKLSFYYCPIGHYPNIVLSLSKSVKMVSMLRPVLYIDGNIVMVLTSNAIFSWGSNFSNDSHGFLSILWFWYILIFEDISKP